MKIELKEILVRDIVKNYKNRDEEGITGYDGKLNIRPKYQREFIYKDNQRNAVLETIKRNFPLNTMYWVKNGNGVFEVLDGQQRTISVCEYIDGNFSVSFSPKMPQFFHNLTDNEKEQILNYKFMIYFCEGNDKEKLDWFKTINIAGEKLSNQELRNAIYTGTWLSSAKKYFSKTKCPAYNIAKDYIKGSPIRQDFLEVVIDWISDGHIEEYMSKNQKKPDANDLWLYFNKVMNWTRVNFQTYRKEMKGINWGKLYNEFKDYSLDAKKIDNEIHKLMLDEDIIKKSGIYYYILNRNERFLNIRCFSNKQKRETYEKQNGICVKCNKQFKLEEMEADHIIPWSKGGATETKNCQMLCKKDNRLKSNK